VSALDAKKDGEALWHTEGDGPKQLLTPEQTALRLQARDGATSSMDDTWMESTAFSNGELGTVYGGAHDGHVRLECRTSGPGPNTPVVPAIFVSDPAYPVFRAGCPTYKQHLLDFENDLIMSASDFNEALIQFMADELWKRSSEDGMQVIVLTDRVAQRAGLSLPVHVTIGPAQPKTTVSTSRPSQ
jgi:hypothetical protein